MRALSLLRANEPMLEISSGGGSPDVITLQHVDPEVTKPLVRRSSLDALRDDLETERVTQRHHRGEKCDVGCFIVT